MGPSPARSPEHSDCHEIVAVRSSKRKVKHTGDEEYTSAHKVGSIDDLLIKILTGLPLSSLRLSQSVCKRWSFLITDPFFNVLRYRNPNSDHPHVFFLQLRRASSEFAFVPLDHVKTHPLIKSFPFNPKSGFIEVLHSCNGLVLCHERPDKLYVYNPTLNQCKLLPLPHIWIPNRIINGMAMAYDPKVSPHYKVVYPREDFNNPNVPVHLEIYSSESGYWRVCEETFSMISFLMFDIGIVYWRDAIHWMDNLEVYHFNCDIENPHFMEVDNPRILNGTEYGLCAKLFASRDCLLIVKMVGLFKMNVYEMKDNCYSGWSIRYHINLESAGNFDLLSRPNFSLLRRLNFNLLLGPSFNVLSVVLGKRDEDSFLVLEVTGTGSKLVRYNIFSKTLHELCDLASFELRNTDLGKFLFTLSLVGV